MALVDNPIRFFSAVSTELDTDEALRALVAQIDSQSDGPNFDYAVVFVSRHFALQARHISKTLRAALQTQVLLGCSAEGIIGPEHEIESAPAIALMAAHLPSVTLKPFVLHPETMAETLDDADAFLQAIDPLESATTRYSLYVVDRDGSDLRLLFPPEGEVGLRPQPVAWSPQVDQVAVVNHGDLYLVNVADGTARPLTGDGINSNPVWASSDRPNPEPMPPVPTIEIPNDPFE